MNSYQKYINDNPDLIFFGSDFRVSGKQIEENLFLGL